MADCSNHKTTLLNSVKYSVSVDILQIEGNNSFSSCEEIYFDFFYWQCKTEHFRKSLGKIRIQFNISFFISRAEGI